MMDINDGAIMEQPILLDPDAVVPMTRGAWIMLSQVIKTLEHRVQTLENRLQDQEEQPIYSGHKELVHAGTHHAQFVANGGHRCRGDYRRCVHRVLAGNRYHAGDHLVWRSTL